MTTTLTPTEKSALLNLVLERFHADMAEPDFDEEWSNAPKSITRVTEMECAEYFYERGRIAERGKLIAEQNDDYREMLRVGRERLSR